MATLAKVGDFCPNETCADYGRLQADPAVKNLKKFGKTRQGRQRYQCKTCGQTFCARYGTLFYRRRTDPAEILETLALLAEGSRISSLARVKGHKEDTIRAWLYEAGQHMQAVEDVLLAEYQVSRGQLDGLWAYVGHKGQKKAMKRPPKRAPSGARR